MAAESTCRLERIVEWMGRIRVPVPRNRLVQLTVLGGALSVVVALLLANPGAVPGVAGATDGMSAGAKSMLSGGTAADSAAGAGVAGGVTPVSNGLETGTATIEKSGTLDVRVAGEFAPGNVVTVTVLRDGTPVGDAVVVVDGHYVGRTDAAGQIDVIVREDGAEITAEAGDATGTLDVDLEGVRP